MILRGNSGFGDSLYLYAIAKYYASIGDDVNVMTSYPMVFDSIKNINCISFNRRGFVDVDACYCKYKYDNTTNQWQDICKAAGIEYIEFGIDKPEKKITSPYICVIAEYMPMGLDRCSELSPDHNYIQEIINHYKDSYEIVLIGRGSTNYSGIDHDCRDIGYNDLKSVVYNSCMLLCQQGWGTAMAEGLDVPLCVVWSHKGLLSDNRFLSSITPNKIFSKKTSIAIIDNEPINYDRINENANIS